MIFFSNYKLLSIDHEKFHTYFVEIFSFSFFAISAVLTTVSRINLSCSVTDPGTSFRACLEGTWVYCSIVKHMPIFCFLNHFCTLIFKLFSSL